MTLRPTQTNHTLEGVERPECEALYDFTATCEEDLSIISGTHRAACRRSALHAPVATAAVACVRRAARHYEQGPGPELVGSSKCGGTWRVRWCARRA